MEAQNRMVNSITFGPKNSLTIEYQTINILEFCMGKFNKPEKLYIENINDIKNPYLKEIQKLITPDNIRKLTKDLLEKQESSNRIRETWKLVYTTNIADNISEEAE